jgi:hypothetical protein
VIYFARSRSQGWIKIGCSVNVEGRLYNYNRYGYEMDFLAVMPGGFGEEREIHERFVDLRIKTERGAIPRAERFHPGPSLMAFILGLSDPAVACGSEDWEMVRRGEMK